MAAALSVAAPAATPPAGAAATRATGLTLQQSVGQRVIGSLPGTTVPAELAAKIRRGELGGVILFARNISSRPQLKALTDRLQAERKRGPRALRSLPLLVMIDQEGGLVKRLPGAPQLSPVQVAARNSADLARRTGVAAAANLTGVGVNVNLAPVLDLGLPGSSVLELGRTYGSTPAQVSKLGVAFASGLRAGGVLASAKHFPGLGRGGHDEDLKLNRIDVPLSTLRASDELPFRAAARAGVPLTMVSTGVYPALDSRPAMFSPRIVQRELREVVGFDGVVVTDDLEVPAIAHLSPERKALAAVRAGDDLLLFCQTASAADRGAAALVRAVRSGAISRAAIDDGAERAISLRAALR
ncbi:glycoside hydrolase family 3 N-terminal domain-containing protein [Conexibacter sp. JD483]|uniref:glycoside hydrolase family 3 N-terminal domain-containing protein n=1 Tax=unclassified Conexibacter TaxID=2627773 RepID=UPI00271B4BA9|nr:MULTISPECIES: glycoside hydrolase family 3 N-terminal domain-containing protein [unclassified Conexibacter]MDO8185708.1 glycoside hydrolase family 3 N-terminal domain-containing protein [Conexibacter sp. CPCC 205706]MDO8199085.1 glycoside hydrolase family 3 N-terminal domain-containing protein [Conexibacter sp. CPCC 205762]MDR9370496.1 glycoside hydrolase family 3 N-terminal domain-containing protein [Conexibacter sp. JD483]